jgi:hypothetical protein
MNRTGKDHVNIVSAGITPRIVKGAYHGDYQEFDMVQERFKGLVEMVLPTGAAFLVATHDPELLEWLTSRLADEKPRVEFGVPKGFQTGQKWNWLGKAGPYQNTDSISMNPGAISQEENITFRCLTKWGEPRHPGLVLDSHVIPAISIIPR